MSQTPPDVLDQPHLLLTELRPTGTLFAGKEILADGSIKSAPRIKRWRHQQVGFDSINEVYRYIVQTQYDNAIIIRGLTETTNGIVLRRKHCARAPNGFHDRRAAFLPFDIDDIAIASNMWRSSPRKAVEAVVRRLGEPFTSTSYVAQLTATHGLIRDADGRWTGEVGGDVMSVRVFFMTERGIGADEATAWLELLRDTRLPEVDARVGRLVQIIYVARPRWHGHDRNCDPLGDIKPCWLVRRKRERLPVPDDLATRTRWRQTTGCVGSRIRKVQAVDVEAAVASIGTPLGEDGGRGAIYDWLLLAARLLVAQHSIDEYDNIQAQAWDLRDQLAQMVADAHDRIDANLHKHGRPNDAALIEKYLQDDVARWIAWLIEHGVTHTKTVRRGRAEQASAQVDEDELAAKRELIDRIGEDLTDNGEGFFEAKAVAKAEREAEQEAEQQKRKRHG